MPLHRLYTDRGSGTRSRDGISQEGTAVNTFVGQSLERLEDNRLLRGKATFVDDIQLEDMVYLAILRSPIAHGRLVRVDLTRAAEMDGVVAAFAGTDLD